MRDWGVWLFLLLSLNGVRLECPAMCRCTSLSSDCSNNDLAELPANISAQIEVLDLSYNNFMTIPAQISQFKKLKRLLLRHNRIDAVGKNALLNMAVLEELDLSENSIDRWSDIYGSVLLPAKSLNTLDISHNSLKGLPMLTSVSLKWLKASNCTISYISTGFGGQLPNLRELDLGDNKLSAITVPMSNKKLQRLNLTNSGVEQIYVNVFSDLTALKELSLTQNRGLKRFKVRSKTLKYLDLSGCGLETVPKSYLPSLIQLNLHGNRILKVESVSFNMTSVRMINLSNNAIEEVHEDAFVGLKNVSRIDLSSNVIQRLSPLTFVTNTNLDELLVSRNYITELVPFQSKSVTHLDLSECEIRTIKQNSLAEMPALVHLNLSRNVFTSIPSNFTAYNLQVLDLGLCRITHLRNESLKQMPKLRVLNLVGNRLVEIRPEALHNVISVRLSDNSWRCDCESANLKNLFIALTKINSDSSTLTCQSPESLEGRTWYNACGGHWFDIYDRNKEHAWIYSLIFIVIMFVIFFIMIYFNKSRKKQRERMEQRARDMADARERLRRLHMREEALEERNAPDPRELERPPSYNEAILMPQPMGSCGSIASRKSNGSTKQSKPKTRRKRRKSKSAEGQQSTSRHTDENTDEPNSLSPFLESDV